MLRKIYFLPIMALLLLTPPSCRNKLEKAVENISQNYIIGWEFFYFFPRIGFSYLIRFEVVEN